MKRGIVSILVMIVLLACGRERESIEEKQEVKPVKTIEAIRRSIKKEVVGNSDILPMNRVTQITKPGGEVVEIGYKNGDLVAKGDLVVKIYNEEVISRYERARAENINREAQMERRKKFAERERRRDLQEAKAAYIQAREELSAAEKRWQEGQINYERNSQLYNEGLISEIEFLQLESSYQEAKATYTSLKSGGVAEKKDKYELAAYRVKEKEWEYDIREAVSAYELALAEYNAAKKDYDDLDIRARIGGRVANMDLDLYDEIDENIPLFDILDTQVVRVETTVAGSDISHISLEDKVEVWVEDLEERYIGEVYEINPQADIATRRFPVKVAIDNPQGRLKSGMYAKVIMKSVTTEGLVVPKEAVMIRELVEYIAVVRDGEAKILAVSTGISEDNQVEVRGDGLEEGDRVVVRGQYLLEDGDRVREVE
ncbi:hypothetical protein PM10SUCC1_07590 [Propionigenium maris DSM 9537]|uniref:RND family efflux transporter, MFP subunit n=1 Tax=Propionigenium maris DSM 9537 TaxID=1123000 RepID=A0A9W6GJW8_9FUSO|nr:efflux RND transporter periplasmic adaptor subunit [Propionigenium maris]GLI55244.1 hypothetical protein PM10SUCC1_07590 [Propionigenium maris DSM 9537]